MPTDTARAIRAAVLPFPDAYIGQLEALLNAARRVRSARDALTDYEQMATRRRAALEDNLDQALTAFLDERARFGESP
jgi:hypothetical protein